LDVLASPNKAQVKFINVGGFHQQGLLSNRHSCCVIYVDNGSPIAGLDNMVELPDRPYNS
jgi:hypothetical protein